MTLNELIQQQMTGKTINYSNTEAIYLSTPFSGESEVRFGQRMFENGGLLDDKRFLCGNDTFTNAIDFYIDSEYSEDYSTQEIAEYLVEHLGD